MADQTATLVTETQGPRRMVGLRRHFGWADVAGVPGVWADAVPLLDTLGPVGTTWGLSLAPADGDPAEGFDYMAAIESDAAPPAGLEAVDLPGGTWARFGHDGPISGLPAACRRAFDTVAAADGWAHAGGAVQIVERYGAAFDPGRGEGLVELFVPVVPA